MDINKKQLIEQLRYLAENDPVQLKEIIEAATISKSNNLEDSNVAYISTDEIKKQQIQKIRANNFKRFGEVSRFPIEGVTSKKVITLVRDKRYINERQVLILDLLKDEYFNYYKNYLI
jgi:predicted DNA-binding protein